MRVAFYGNNLDTGYRFVASLVEMGIEARLFCARNALEQDTHGWWSAKALDPGLVEWVDTASLPIANLAPILRSSAIRTLYDRLRYFDVLVCAEDGPAIFSALRDVPLVFFAFGSDLQILPFLLRTKAELMDRVRRVREVASASTKSRFRTALRALRDEALQLMWLAMLQQRQRRGIRRAVRVICLTHQLPLCDALGIPRSRVTAELNIPMDTDLLADVPSDEAKAFGARFGNYDTVFLHPTRHFYLRLDSDPFLKDNDKLLRAYAKFARTTRSRVLLVLVRKGRAQDLAASERLVDELGIASHVAWLPELSNRSLRALYALDNVVVCDQYNPLISTLGNIGREATYFGRPLITAYRRHNEAAYAADWPPHVFACETEDEITDALSRVAAMSPEDRAALRQLTRSWYARNLDKRVLMPRFVALLKEACER